MFERCVGMRVAIYIRVSTEEQAQHGYSIDAQKDRLIAYCTSQGWSDYKIYIDDGYTGTKMIRPALNRLIRHIEDGKIDLVVVYKLDRLSRKQLDVLYLLEEVFEKHNVGFKSATEPFETTTPFGKAMIGILAVFAQLERDMIVERTTIGRRQRVSKGEWYGGRIPFGYKMNRETKQLEIVPEEAKIIKEIYKMYLQGNSRLSIAEWAAERTKARVIDHSVIRNILSRPVYMGKLSNAGNVVDGKHEAIIDEKTWHAVQKETKERKEGATPLGEYLLTGLLKCGVCGGPIVHVKRITRKYGKEYLYELYACKNQHVRKKDRNNNCTLGYIRREKVEKFVIEQIKSYTTDDLLIKQIANEKNKFKDNDESALSNLESQLKKVLTGLENLYDAIESGEIKASSISDRIRKLEEQRDVLENHIDEIKDNTPQNDLNIQEFDIFIKEIGEAWDYLTEDEQKAMIRKAFCSVTLHKDKYIEVEWNFAP
ncbi:site-specific DNA recombinase-like protein [Paenibacillus larvae subsp. larvae B-3650]|nr:site-specific DNA recombinase-like protein [Paenibacillus larvae subsp. larvae B-3650]